MASYNYSVSTDFPNGAVCADRLKQEILDSSITIALVGVDVDNDVCSVDFKADLPDEDKVTLDDLVAAHSGETMPKADIPVEIKKSNTIIESKQVGFVDLSGYNAYRRGYGFVARPKQTTNFDIKYDRTMKLQGLRVMLDENVNEGCLNCLATADEQNSGNGTIEIAEGSNFTKHHRKYEFTVSDIQDGSLILDWTSDTGEPGSVDVTSETASAVTIEDGLVISLGSFSEMQVGDKFRLVIDPGDYFDVAIVDCDGVIAPAGAVLVTFAEKVHVSKNWQLEAVYPDAKDIPPYFYIRLAYTSTYGEQPVKVKFDHILRTVPNT